MCPEHALARQLDELASAYLDFAQELEGFALLAEDDGKEEALWPAPPGPKELRRLALDSIRIARRRLIGLAMDLADRQHPREVSTDPEYVRGRRIVEEGLLEQWPGRPSTHTPISQDEWTKLTAVLGLLAPSERRAFWLVNGQGLSHRQAAREMKTSAGNVYNLLGRAEAKIEAWRNGGKPAQAQLHFGEAAD